MIVAALMLPEMTAGIIAASMTLGTLIPGTHN
jgi:hypothetical protein